MQEADNGNLILDQMRFFHALEYKKVTVHGDLCDQPKTHPDSYREWNMSKSFNPISGYFANEK